MTIARPYARAAFEFAIENNRVIPWQDFLALASEAVRHDMITQNMGNLVSGQNSIAEILIDLIAASESKQADIQITSEKSSNSLGRVEKENFIRILTENCRLGLLPQIHEQFVSLKKRHEKKADVELTSSEPLSQEQQRVIAQKLAHKLGQEIQLNCHINKNLLGGMIIRTGDEVIDNSVHGRLARLSDTLQF